MSVCIHTGIRGWRRDSSVWFGISG